MLYTDTIDLFSYVQFLEIIHPVLCKTLNESENKIIYHKPREWLKMAVFIQHRDSLVHFYTL